jgi:hypothetical protein
LLLKNSFGGQGGNPHGKNGRVFHPEKRQRRGSQQDAVGHQNSAIETGRAEGSQRVVVVNTLRKMEISRDRVPRIAEGDSHLSVSGFAARLR